MSTIEQSEAGSLADRLSALEVAIQDRMWGDANERADSTENQLIGAAQAQLQLTWLIADGVTPERARALAYLEHYPEGWDGFRSYGSPVANLVVAAAYLRSEIKRRILNGEDTTRTARGEAYTTAQPYVSSDVAIGEAQ
jgi:hypothetical protein